MTHPIDITNKDELVEHLGPESGAAIIDFWAPWCGPCRAMAPHFTAAAEHYASEPVGFFKINTQDSPELGQLFNVRALPTTVLLVNGKIEDVIPGMLGPDKIRKRVEWVLSKARGESAVKRFFKTL